VAARQCGLAALDEIIDEQQQRLEEHRKRQIEKAVRLRQDRHRKSVSNSERSADQKVEGKEIRQHVEKEHPAAVCIITLTLSSGDKIRVGSFREAADDVTCKGHAVTKVEVGLRCADIRGDLVVPTPDKNHGLSLITLPEASEPADELFVRLNQWAEQFKPASCVGSKVCRPGLLVAFAGVLMIVVAVLGIITRAIPTKNSWRTEARMLVARGVKPEDHSRALELLLRQSAGLDNDVEFSQIPLWYKVTFATVMVAAILLSFGGRHRVRDRQGRGESPETEGVFNILAEDHRLSDLRCIGFYPRIIRVQFSLVEMSCPANWTA